MDIITFLKNKGFEFIGEIDFSIFYFKKEVEGIPFIFSVTKPHKDIKNCYMLRANNEADFDKWGNADYEAYFKDFDDFKNNYLEWLCSKRWDIDEVLNQ